MNQLVPLDPSRAWALVPQCFVYLDPLTGQSERMLLQLQNGSQYQPYNDVPMIPNLPSKEIEDLISTFLSLQLLATADRTIAILSNTSEEGQMNVGVASPGEDSSFRILQPTEQVYVKNGELVAYPFHPLMHLPNCNPIPHMVYKVLGPTEHCVKVEANSQSVHLNDIADCHHQELLLPLLPPSPCNPMPPIFGMKWTSYSWCMVMQWIDHSTVAPISTLLADYRLYKLRGKGRVRSLYVMVESVTESTLVLSDPTGQIVAQMDIFPELRALLHSGATMKLQSVGFAHSASASPTLFIQSKSIQCIWPRVRDVSRYVVVQQPTCSLLPVYSIAVDFRQLNAPLLYEFGK